MTSATPNDITGDLQIGAEYPPPGEDEAIAKLRALHLKVHQVSPGPKLRGEHPKQHGGVWAAFQIAADIPPEYRVGLFREPRSLRAFIRFSNGRQFDDRDPNVRGLAIKVFTVDNAGDPPVNQDFILADHPVFFAQNVQHIFEFLVASSANTPPEKLVASFPKLIGYTKVAKQSPLQLSYWSQTPYQLGTGAVKYFATPSQEQDQVQPNLALTNSENCLREAMIEQLTRRKIGVNFDFCINPQTDANAMPVEDPTIEWTSPPVRLATISIYPQRFDSAEQMQFVENSVWSPWNHLTEHRPLGGINRARQWVYADSQDLRHKTNAVAPTIPTGREAF
ncbi:MAG: catalase [Planctomycetota bacterium]